MPFDQFCGLSGLDESATIPVMDRFSYPLSVAACLLILVILIGRRLIRRKTPASPPCDWNAAASHCLFTAPGRHLLRDEGFHSLNHRRGGVVKGFLAPRVAVPGRNAHH